FSEDQLQLIAAIQGQPSLDAKGAISVLEQFTVKGDVDFKTGNINFAGNVLVTGMVKEGFKVECDDLTANEINGATILIRGDLKVSNGIVNSHIETQGNVQAKFLNNVRIFAHGNMMITREIMGSRIVISGALSNEAGRITASFIAARMGLSVKQIGTEKAESSTIKTGVNDHIRWIAEKFEVKISLLEKELDETIRQKHLHDETYNGLHVDVANQTFAQEKLNKKMEFIENMVGKAATPEEKQKLVKELKEIEISIEQSDGRIKGIFQEQDAVMQKIQDCDTKIEELNTQISSLQKERDGATRRLEKEDAIPMLKVNKKLYRGTKIMGTMASTILQNDVGMSKFMEIDSQNPDSPKQITHQTLNL
ncbi:MAG: FapA family protein, partial [Proteobacteria bacterium]|nr:FapA family protein [Pseudomonadota bacterium]